MIYPVTDTALAGGIPHATIVERLCMGGATLIQMREKRLSDDEMLMAAQAAVLAARAAGARLVINDRVDIAHLSLAAGAHVGGDDLPPAEARILLGAGAVIGCSTHSVEEAVCAASLPVDYIAIGPIFATKHSSMVREPLGIDAIAEAAKRVKVPLVAIGGINLSRAREALSAGAASVAVIGDLMTAADIPERVARYLELRPA